VAYAVKFTPAAERQIKDFDKPIQRQILTRIANLADNPRPNGVEKMKGEENLYRIRLGNYRILHTINDKHLLVLIVKVGDRKEVYRHLPKQ
jgi:mRNA interferase RelE/StbE